MLTTLSITSMNQGKIAPRYDVEPKTAEELAQFLEPQTVTRSTRIGRFFLSTLAGILAPIRHRKPGKLHHA